MLVHTRLYLKMLERTFCSHTLYTQRRKNMKNLYIDRENFNKEKEIEK